MQVPAWWAKVVQSQSFFFMWSIFASDMCIQPLLSFLCFFKVYKRWTNLSIKLPAPSRDFHFLRSHVSSHSPIIFAKSCQKLHACNWLKTEFRHQNWTLFTSCYALPCDNELKWFLKEQWPFLFSCNYFFTIKSLIFLVAQSSYDVQFIIACFSAAIDVLSYCCLALSRF